MRSSVDVDVPLACKLDVVAGPCTNRGYTNTEDVLEVCGRVSAWAATCTTVINWCAHLLSHAACAFVCPHISHTSCLSPSTWPARADHHRAQPGHQHAAERRRDLGAARGGAVEQRGQVLEGAGAWGLENGRARDALHPAAPWLLPPGP